MYSHMYVIIVIGNNTRHIYDHYNNNNIIMVIIMTTMLIRIAPITIITWYTTVITHHWKYHSMMLTCIELVDSAPSSYPDLKPIASRDGLKTANVDFYGLYYSPPKSQRTKQNKYGSRNLTNCVLSMCSESRCKLATLLLKSMCSESRCQLATLLLKL